MLAQSLNAGAQSIGQTNCVYFAVQLRVFLAPFNTVNTVNPPIWQAREGLSVHGNSNKTTAEIVFA